MNQFEKARSQFPAAMDRTYLDAAARSPMSDRVRAAIEAYLDVRQRSLDDKHEWLAKVDSARAKVASLIGAAPDDIAFTKNTSHGLTSVIAALPWRDGDNVVIAPDFEHPNNVYAWLPLRRRGIMVKTLPLAGPVVTVDQLAAACDDRTRAIGIASVSFATGGRLDLDALARFSAERGIFLLVDAVQSLGLMPIDVGRTPLNALAAATSKGLLGLYGLGVLYCRDAAALHPAGLSRFGVDWGEEREYVMGDEDYELLPGAKRFDLGNPNYLAIHALDAALDQIQEVGVANIQRHVLGLAGALTEGLAGLGCRLVSSLEPGTMSHVVVFNPPAGGPDSAEVSRLLNAEGIRHTIRRFGLRLSFHMYNNQADVDRVLAVLARILGRRA